MDDADRLWKVEWELYADTGDLSKDSIVRESAEGWSRVLHYFPGLLVAKKMRYRDWMVAGPSTNNPHPSLVRLVKGIL